MLSDMRMKLDFIPLDSMFNKIQQIMGFLLILCMSYGVECYVRDVQAI